MFLRRYLNSCRCGCRIERHQRIFDNGILRSLSTEANVKLKVDEHKNDVRPFADIPGPSKFTFVRNFMPGGRYHNASITDMIIDLNKNYGQIFRMPGLFDKKDVIMSMNPDDYSVIFRNEGQYPYRRSFDTVEYFRRFHRPEFFGGNEGIVSTNGEKWATSRTAVNPILMQPKNVKLYFNNLLDVNEDFLMRIRDIRNPTTQEMPENFEDDIKRFTFESVGAVALNTKLGLLGKNRDASEPELLLQNLRRFVDLSFDLEIMPSIWKYVKTPKFKEMMKVLDTITDIINKYIQEALVRIEYETKAQNTSEVGKEKSVVEKLIKIDKNLAVVMAMDMLMAGVDTTTTTLTGILLCIAKNPEKQNTLLLEIKEILPNKNTPLTMQSMHNLPYLRACIKEGIRMYPIGPGTMRRMPHEVVLSGYRIPEGTDVTLGANVQMCLEQFVPHAKDFLPERWLRGEDKTSQLIGEIATPFMYVPFGFGPRSCVGKRIVDLLLEITIARLVRNFQIEFDYSVDNAFKAKFFSVANIPLKFKFTEREN